MRDRGWARDTLPTAGGQGWGASAWRDGRAPDGRHLLSRRMFSVSLKDREGGVRPAGGTAAGEPAAVGSPTAGCSRRRGPPAGAEGLLRLHCTLLGLEPEVLHVLPELLVEPLLHAGAQPLAPPVCGHRRASGEARGQEACGAGARGSPRADAGPRQAMKGSAPQNRARPAPATRSMPAHKGALAHGGRPRPRRGPGSSQPTWVCIQTASSFLLGTRACPGAGWAGSLPGAVRPSQWACRGLAWGAVQGASGL